jgi:hypothetical protein
MTTFADLKVGDEYILTSEDDPEVTTQGKITEIAVTNGNISVQFDDELGTFTWGKPTDRIHSFMEKIPCQE